MADYPINRRFDEPIASASQAAASATTTTTATTTALETDLDALRVLVNRIRADLITQKIIKGSA